MELNIRHWYSLISIIIFLSSCTTFPGKDNTQQAACREIKQRIVLNGATSLQPIAQRQRAELDRLSQTYRDECS